MSNVLRLGIYLHDRYRTDGRFTVSNSESLNFIERLGLAESLTLAVSAIREKEIRPENYRIVLEKRGINLIALPGWETMMAMLRSLPRTLRYILRAGHSLIDKSDLLWFRVPSIVAVPFLIQARRARKPVIVHVAGNALLAGRSPRYRGVKSALAKVLAYGLHLVTRWMGRYGLLLVTGGELQRLMENPLHPAYQLDDVLFLESSLKPLKRSTKQGRELLFVGRFARGKGVELLIEAVKDLRTEFPEIRLRMAGDGPLLEPMRRLVVEYDLERNVEILGFVQSNGPLDELYKEADIFVLPSDSYPEGFPRVILEAWAAGLPLVATSLGGIPYRVRNEINGLLIKPGSLEELRYALKRLIEDTELRYQLAKKGHATVRSLAFEHQAQRIRQLLSQRYPELGIYFP